LQVLASTRRAHDVDIAVIADFAEKSAKLCGPAGVKQVSDALSKSQVGWCESAWRTEKTLEHLTAVAQALDSFDSTFEELMSWVANTEEKLLQYKLGTDVNELKKVDDELMVRGPLRNSFLLIVGTLYASIS
jgi:hypothetical protein